MTPSDRTTAIGQMIDTYLRSQSELDDHAIHLLFSANRWECATDIERDLAAGTTVVADRYAFSGIAFSAAKGLEFDYCLNPDTGLPLPDLTLFLTVPPEIASTRSAYGIERYETLEIQTRVRAQFASVAQEVKMKHGADRWHSVDAGGTADEVEAIIWQAVQEALKNKTERVGRLWS